MVIVPAVWQKKTIADIADIIQGGTPSTLIREYWDGGIIWVTPTDITSLRGMRISNSARTISQLGLDNSSASLVPADTILLCSRATIGALALSTTEVATNQGFKNLICKAGVDPVFIAYALSTKKEEMSRLSIGTTFLEISKSNLAKIELYMPSFLEQQAIARVLSAFDEHLANLDELIAKKKAIRDGALDDLISGRQRIQGFQSEWRQVKFLNEIAPKARIGWHGLTTDEYLSSGHSYLISGTDFDHGVISTDEISFVDESRYEMDPYIQVDAGDVLVTKDGTIGKVAVVPPLNKPATLNSGVFVLRPKASLRRGFLYWVLMSPVFTRFITSLAAGSTIKHLYQKDLKAFSFYAPNDLEEQKCIEKILFKMDDEIRLLVKERAKVERLKFGAMDDLLTGRVRLPLDEEMV